MVSRAGTGEVMSSVRSQRPLAMTRSMQKSVICWISARRASAAPGENHGTKAFLSWKNRGGSVSMMPALAGIAGSAIPRRVIRSLAEENVSSSRAADCTAP